VATSNRTNRPSNRGFVLSRKKLLQQTFALGFIRRGKSIGGNSSKQTHSSPACEGVEAGNEGCRDSSRIASQSESAEARQASKLVLPCFTLNEVCREGDEGACPFEINHAGRSHLHFSRLVLVETGSYVGGIPELKPVQFNLFPVVRLASGVPSTEASLYILSQLLETTSSSTITFDGIAEDLTAYARFLDDQGVDWKKFPTNKLSRPTYRYSAYLSALVMSGQLAAASASRRMSAVIAFYRWLASHEIFSPANPAWKDRELLLKLTGTYGGTYSKQVVTTDISIKVPTQSDPYDGTIEDGGQLRPLTNEEQSWILEALFSIGNTEMTLIHILALTTGARIQTVLTFSLRSLRNLSSRERTAAPSTEIRCPAGPGTDIDTKKDKRASLFIPLWVHEMLETYAASDRARKRRALSENAEGPAQNLFLTKYGTPFYSRKADSRKFNPHNERRSAIRGQAIRTFKSSAVIPYIRNKYDAGFRFRFHDLRASFGMNLTDSQLKLVAEKKITLTQARQFVAERMWHSSSATTDGYLEFRATLQHVQQVQDDYDDNLRLLVKKAGLL
jgi:hypothetical protein